MTGAEADSVSGPRDRAQLDLLAASERAGVSVSALLSPTEVEKARELMEDIWGPAVVVPRNVLRGLAIAGTFLLVAERGGQPVGFAMGFLGWENGLHLHSHQVGVREAARGSGVGMALKLAQRLICLEHGVTEMRWTFDPLLRPNAMFNLHRLGARVRAFLPDCYGPRQDNFNTGERTDRLEVSWDLTGPLGAQCLDGGSGPPLVDPEPIPHRSESLPVAGSVVAIPADYAALRTTDRTRADAWRVSVASALADVADAGLAVAGLSQQGYLVGGRAR